MHHTDTDEAADIVANLDHFISTRQLNMLAHQARLRGTQALCALAEAWGIPRSSIVNTARTLDATSVFTHVDFEDAARSIRRIHNYGRPDHEQPTWRDIIKARYIINLAAGEPDPLSPWQSADNQHPLINDDLNHVIPQPSLPPFHNSTGRQPIDRADIPWFDVDTHIIPVIALLNDNGFRTLESCQSGQGHGYDAPTVILDDMEDAELDQARHLLRQHGYTLADTERDYYSDSRILIMRLESILPSPSIRS